MSKRSLVKIEVVSKGFAQLIDYLSENYHMRFTIVSTGNDYWAKDLTEKIFKYSKSASFSRHSNRTNKTDLLDFDESCIVFQKSFYEGPEYYLETKYSGFRYKLTLLFDVTYVDSKVKGVMENEKNYRNLTGFPHDYYQMAHSPENGSLWLMSNEMFFNKSCDLFYHCINFFNSTSMEWTSSKFFNKYETFNHCEIEIGIESFFQQANYSVNPDLILQKNKFLYLILAVFADKHKVIKLN